MGERLRLQATVDISGLPRQARVVARAMREYGLIVADNGSDWFVSGAPSRAGTTTSCARSARCAGATSRSCGSVDLHAAAADRQPAAPGQQLQQLVPDELAAPAAQRADVGLRRPRRAATTIGARSARAAISS